jgi:TPP-dependent pyruvate/acetoin dehydrogenase alpha subunit
LENRIPLSAYFLSSHYGLWTKVENAFMTRASEFESTGGLPAATLIGFHRQLLLLRRSEEMLAERYKDQVIRTPTHFGVGQEAIAVGISGALESGDVVFSHHRCHNHYLAWGGKLEAMVAELFGRKSGCSRGRGGSVHLTDREAGVIATSAILGQTVAAATGAALAFSMDGEPNVAVSFFGDATCEEGVFYESLNFAAIRRLPVLFVCENNLYSTESPLAVRQPANTDLCERVNAFKVAGQRVDGNDVVEIYHAAVGALARCRNGGGPVFLECPTYRWYEHVGPYFDFEFDRTYRDKAELEAWMARCPVKRSAERLLAGNLATREEIENWDEECMARIRDAIDHAEADAWPHPNDLCDGVT